MVKEKKVYISVVLDRSGSMQSVATDTVGGLNAFIDEQKNLPGKCSLTLAQFDTEAPYEVLIDNKPIAEVEPLVNFYPRGGTPLFDAIGKAIANADERVGSKKNTVPIIVIITDGQENSSREFNSSKIKELIAAKKELGWQFVFIGADEATVSAAVDWGLSRDNTLSYAHNSVGTKGMYASMSANVGRSRGAAMSGGVINSNFLDDDYKVQEEAKSGS